MSTRCVINFMYGTDVSAKIYRHSDGYPDTEFGVLADLKRFFSDVQAGTMDTRFGDPTYLAAKFVVWQAAEFQRGESKFNFLSLGVCMQDPGDIEYRYFIQCQKSWDDKTLPAVSYEKVRS